MILKEESMKSVIPTQGHCYPENPNICPYLI